MKKLIQMKQKAVAGVVTAITYANYMVGTAYASGTGGSGGGTSGNVEKIVKPLKSLKTLVIAVIGAIGVIIIAKNVMEFAQAYQQQDSSTMHSALKGIVAGVMMASVSTVLTILGI
ncbi:hypothetical protein SAMN02910358_00702 [Lachnospiraceae bacterium XBB1006]|nr:hypothetical protein SAMN02910358_00702 [Lachnospiraceae bacterium XBB1006]